MKHSSRTPRNTWPSYIVVGLALVIVALLMWRAAS